MRQQKTILERRDRFKVKVRGNGADAARRMTDRGAECGASPCADRRCAGASDSELRREVPPVFRSICAFTQPLIWTSQDPSIGCAVQRNGIFAFIRRSARDPDIAGKFLTARLRRCAIHRFTAHPKGARVALDATHMMRHRSEVPTRPKRDWRCNRCIADYSNPTRSL